MSNEVLSQREVESLLCALGDSGAADKAAPAARLPGKIVPYDFQRPERVGKDQVNALQSLHEGFSRNFGAALSTLLRTIVEVKLTSVDQLSYSEFIYALDNPTCFNVIRAAPLEGRLILDVSPALLHPIIDRLLGGGKGGGAVVRRPLTEIELRLVSKITGIFLEELGRAWENVLPLELSVERVESNPQLVQMVPPNEIVVLIGLEITLGETRGLMNLCIPYNSIERIGDKLTANSWTTYRGGTTSDENKRQTAENLKGATVEVAVALAHTKITAEELIGLRVGDVITTEADKDQPLQVSVAGTPTFTARPGMYKGCKAIRVERSLKERVAAEGGARE